MFEQVRARQLWGNEIYTQDSDLVAVLMHLGYYNHVLAAPPVNALEVCNEMGCYHVEPDLKPIKIYRNQVLLQRFTSPCYKQSYCSRQHIANTCVLLQIRAVIQPLPPQKAYSSCPRNSIRSRAWGTASEGCSYRVIDPSHDPVMLPIA